MDLISLGWKQPFIGQFHALGSPEQIPARVARQDRQGYVVYTDGQAMRASVSGNFRHRANSPDQFPAVGDWVVVTPRDAHSTATIHALLPRASAVHRKVAGQRSDSQVVAANVDRLLICAGLDQDFNPRRIERYVTLAYSSGAAPLIVLTKADVCSDIPARLAQVESVAVAVPIHVTSAATGAGLDLIREQIGPGLTLALVGSSGVGKSTLINALLGRDAMPTGAVRASDGRGRHTTTHRQLLLAPTGGVVIDTPGMREIQLPGDANVPAAFEDIESLAAQCRFRDCTHVQEPGCRVRAAVESGELDAERLESLRKQQRELAYFERRDDPAAVAAEKAKWKSIHKAARRWYEEKYRR